MGTMMLAALSIFLALGGLGAAFPSSLTEAQTRLCADFDRRVPMLPGGYVDCVGDGYAIKVDWVDNWAAALGQSVYWAAEMGLEPGIILICREEASRPTCTRDIIRFEEKVLLEWILPIRVWYCTQRENLDDCWEGPFMLELLEWLRIRRD
jgi:hypothetical protein